MTTPNSPDPNRFTGFSIRVDTPDGKMFVHVMEDYKGLPALIVINIGKCGTALAAWAEATSRLASRCLPSIGLHGIIEEISGITSTGMKRLARGEVIRSGPEGLAYALLRYKQEKYKSDQPKPDYGRASVNS